MTEHLTGTSWTNFSSNEMNMTSNETVILYEPSLLIHSIEITLLITISYGFVFVVGTLGNTFVVLAVCAHKNLNITTDYLIMALALADLFILWFCLPSTVANIIFTEWHFGAILCCISTWANAATSCTSVYTLVAVTADRYLAICHTLKYNTCWDKEYTKYIIIAIWIVSAIAGSPYYYAYNVQVYEDNVTHEIYHICLHTSGDVKIMFFCVNLVFAFFIPFALITALYGKIFITVSNHRSLAIDARAREDRVKLRVAQMMLTVIISFALSWLPLISLFTYITFFLNDTNATSVLLVKILRPIFQLLSLLSSTLNPIIYIAYSHKYRRAFKNILLTPCRLRYERVRSTILRRPPRSSGKVVGESVAFKPCAETTTISSTPR